MIKGNHLNKKKSLHLFTQATGYSTDFIQFFSICIIDQRENKNNKKATTKFVSHQIIHYVFDIATRFIFGMKSIQWLRS